MPTLRPHLWLAVVAVEGTLMSVGGALAVGGILDLDWGILTVEGVLKLVGGALAVEGMVEPARSILVAVAGTLQLLALELELAVLE